MKKTRQLSKVIAHRGAPSLAPENTIAGLHKAKELGAEWVEFDLRLTRDGQVIVIHDATVERTTNGVGEVSDMDFSEIATLNAGDGQHVPLFERWVKVALSLGLNINLEIKTSRREAPVMAEKVHHLLRELWPSHLDKPLISGGNRHFFEVYHHIDPDAVFAWVSTRMPFRWRSRLKEMGMSALVIAKNHVSTARVKALHDEGYKVLAYTVNKFSDAERLFEMGVDSIFTDDLEAMSAFL